LLCLSTILYFFVFFFQAEDGIRDFHVTGVQTCALPIWEEIKECLAGDIAAAIGLKDVTTGDTLCDANQVIILERMEFPEPVISVDRKSVCRERVEMSGAAG